MNKPMQTPSPRPQLSGSINWAHVSTVMSAAILIAAEVFGATFAGAWAISILFNLGDYAHWILQAIFFALGVVVMVAFVRSARRIEPFTNP